MVGGDGNLFFQNLLLNLKCVISSISLTKNDDDCLKIADTRKIIFLNSDQPLSQKFGKKLCFYILFFMNKTEIKWNNLT